MVTFLLVNHQKLLRNRISFELSWFFVESLSNVSQHFLYSFPLRLWQCKYWFRIFFLSVAFKTYLSQYFETALPIYRIFSYSFQGNYSCLNLEIVANSNRCHNISVFYLISWIFSMETIQGQKLYEEIR